MIWFVLSTGQGIVPWYEQVYFDRTFHFPLPGQHEPSGAVKLGSEKREEYMFEKNKPSFHLNAHRCLMWSKQHPNCFRDREIMY